jgi:hypothetical protein
LVALSKRIAPTDKARKLELTQRYQKLKNAPRAQNVDTWLQQWERTYTECKGLNLAVVADEQPVYDFLQAVAEISPEFSNVWMVNLQTKEADSEPLSDFYRIVELFRNHQRLSNAQKGQASQGTFTASFQGQSLQGENSLDLNNKEKLCVEWNTVLKHAHTLLNQFVRRTGNPTKLYRRKSMKSLKIQD